MSKRGHRQKKRRQPLSGRIAGLVVRTANWRYCAITMSACYLVVAGLISFRYHRVLDYGVESDFLFEYVPIARRLALGTLSIGDYRGPVYPIVLAAVRIVSRDYFIAGVIISLISAAATLILCFKLVERLFESKIALATGLLMTVNPFFFMYSYEVGTDMLFVALATASVYFLLVGNDLNWKRVALSALLGALAYLTRYNGVFILAAPALVLALNGRGTTWRRRLVTATLFVAVFLAGIAPWGLYCLRQKGSFFYSQNTQNIAFELYGKERQSRDDFFWRGNRFQNMSIAALVMNDPTAFFSTVAANVPGHGLETLKNLLGWIMSTMALMGLVFLLWRRKISARQSIYLLLNLVFFLVLLPVHFESRYPLFMLAGLLSLTACGVLVFGLADDVRVVAVSTLALLLLVLYSGLNSYGTNRAQIDSGPEEVVAVANWFKANVPADQRGKTVAARKPHIAYYAGLDYVPLPIGDSPEQLVRQLKEMKVDYLYFGRIEYEMRPALRNLIDPKGSFAGLERMTSSNAPLSVLYRVEPD